MHDIPKEKEHIYSDAVENIEKAMWSAVKENVPKELCSHDQLGIAVVALARVIEGYALMMRNAFKESYNHNDVFKMLKDLIEEA